MSTFLLLHDINEGAEIIVQVESIRAVTTELNGTKLWLDDGSGLYATVRESVADIGRLLKAGGFSCWMVP